VPLILITVRAGDTDRSNVHNPVNKETQVTGMSGDKMLKNKLCLHSDDDIIAARYRHNKNYTAVKHHVTFGLQNRRGPEAGVENDFTAMSRRPPIRINS
jgi:hypothetical protein